MAWKQVSTRLVDLSPEVLQWFRELPRIDGDRAIGSIRSKRRVSYLHSRLRTGQFMTPDWCVCSCSANGTVYRINGQASSLVLREADASRLEGLQIYLRELVADTYPDVVAAFNNFDLLLTGRPDAEQLPPLLQSMPQLREVPATKVRKLLGGIAFWQAGGCRSYRTQDERHEMVRVHQDFIAWGAPFIYNRWLQSCVGIHAAMFATWTASKRQAGDFWTHVEQEDGLTRKCPSRVLMELLRTRLQDPVEKLRWTPKALMVKCLQAWNAWVRKLEPAHLHYYSVESTIPPIYARDGDTVVKTDIIPECQAKTKPAALSQE